MLIGLYSLQPLQLEHYKLLINQYLRKFGTRFLLNYDRKRANTMKRRKFIPEIRKNKI